MCAYNRLLYILDSLVKQQQLMSYTGTKKFYSVTKHTTYCTKYIIAMSHTELRKNFETHLVAHLFLIFRYSFTNTVMVMVLETTLQLANPENDKLL